MCYFSEAIYNNECVPLLSSTCTIVDACIIPKKLCSPFKVRLPGYLYYFCHQLCRSNFQFIWPWEEWAYVLELPKWAPQRVFVKEVLDREVRLSYWDKVKQVFIMPETIDIFVTDTSLIQIFVLACL